MLLCDGIVILTGLLVFCLPFSHCLVQKEMSRHVYRQMQKMVNNPTKPIPVTGSTITQTLTESLATASEKYKTNS